MAKPEDRGLIGSLAAQIYSGSKLSVLQRYTPDNAVDLAMEIMHIVDARIAAASTKAEHETAKSRT